MEILVVGSVGIDGLETPAGKRDEVLGGSASHFSLAASLFAPVRMVGVVGDDFPDAYKSKLSARGIDLTGLQVETGRSFRWKGRYEGDCAVAQTLDTQLNVFEHFRPDLPSLFTSSKFVFLANIDPTLQLQVLDQIQSPTLVAGDTMNLWIDIKRDELWKVIERLDLFVLNDEEARTLTGKKGLADAGRALIERGPRIVVIKEGAHGALLVQAEGLFHAPGWPDATLVDPTGAGDSFAGGLMGTLAREGSVNSETLRRAVVNGCVIGSFNIEDFVPERLLELTPERIEERYEAFKELVRFD